MTPRPDEVGVAAVAGVIDRPRLYAVLDSPLVRVCVVQGPSGSGKTTLLRSWVLQRPASTAEPLTWVTLGDGGFSRQAFWRHVVGSARRNGGLSDEAATAVIRQLTATGDPVRTAIELLVRAGPVTLVLDAYEHLGAVTAEVDADLARLLAALPDLRLLITTRGRTALTDVDPPGGVVRVITLSELAMTPDEVGALIARQTGLADERLAASLAQATRGFPLTVRAVALALSQLGRIPNVDSMEWGGVVAARMESLLPDGDAVRFVADTSVPPYVDVELAGALTGQADAEERFDELEQRGFGRWIPYARERQVFQYAETIRDSFRARAAADAERFRASCVATARWLFANDEVDQALAFAIEAEDFDFADRAFVALVIGNPNAYITDRFLPTLRVIPDEVLRRHPMLAFGLGLALAANPVLRLEAPRAFEIAIGSPAQPVYLDPAVDAFTLAAMRAIAMRTAFRFQDSAEACSRAVRQLDGLPPALVAQYGEHIGTILRQVSYSLLQGGRIDEAIAAAVRSVSLCTTQATRNYSIVYAAGASAFAGDLVAARAFAGSIDIDAWPVELRGSYLNGMGTVAEAYRLLDELDFAGALDALRASSSYTPTGEFWPFFTGVALSARIGLGQGRAEAGRVAQLLAGPTPPGVGDNAASAHLHGMLARAWIIAGDHRAAARLLAQQDAGGAHLAAARVSRLLADERVRDALALAEQSLDEPGHTLRSRADLQTVGAVAALRAERPDLAWSWLGSASLAWETTGARFHVALLSVRDRRALWELAEERGAPSVQRYLEVPAIERRAGGPGGSGGAGVALTRRETVVLRALAEHDTIREIAAALVVSPHTVKAQLQSVYRKLGVASRRSALVVGRELGIIPDGGATGPE